MGIGVGRIVHGPGVGGRTPIQSALRADIGGEIADPPIARIRSGVCGTGGGTIRQDTKAHATRAIKRGRR